jgi:hypothetical protein
MNKLNTGELYGPDIQLRREMPIIHPEVWYFKLMHYAELWMKVKTFCIPNRS